MTLIEAAKLTEEEAREYLENIRWPDGPVCPHCECFDRIYDLQGDSHRGGLCKCGECRKQFTVTVNTVMHRSKIPLHKWVLAFHLICSSKKGISAKQLQCNLDLGSYRTAWHMAHRIRAAMKEEPLASMLGGDVEVDETYVGGKPRYKGDNPRGRSTSKTAVMALVERDGDARAKPVNPTYSRRAQTRPKVRSSPQSLPAITADKRKMIPLRISSQYLPLKNSPMAMPTASRKVTANVCEVDCAAEGA